MCLATEVDGSPAAAHPKGGRQGREKSVSFKIAIPSSSSSSLLLSTEERSFLSSSSGSKNAPAATVKLTSRSLVVVLMGCAILSCGAGHFWSDRALEKYSRLLILGSVLVARYQQQDAGSPEELEQQKESTATTPSKNYLYEHFNDAHQVRSYSVWVDMDADGKTQNSTRGGTTEPKTTVSGINHVDDVSSKALNEVEPAGVHLLVDMEHVDSTFLNSEERLAQAMMQLIRDSQDIITTNPPIQLLSYHCHGLEPTGVSCVGVLSPGSAMTFHTWPTEGVIALDLFVVTTTPGVSLIPLLGAFQSLFGVPGENDSSNGGQPRSVWAHKRRGFRTAPEGLATFNVEDVDLHSMLGSHNAHKHPVASVRTPYQHIEIFDVETTLGGDTATDAKEQRRTPQMDRTVYLDGILQSRRFGEAAYHETLVHPALFTHENPRRVVIIGGGEGATLREVLKHKTVTEVIMVEIDDIMVNVSRQYLPEWSDCSDLLLGVLAVESCFDDPRATVYFEDAIEWFTDRYGGSNEKKDELIDVIIMDALDPSSVVSFSDLLYNNKELMEAFSNALGDEGILVAQVGEADDVDEPSETFFPDDNYESFLKGLQEAGFESIIDFDEGHGRLGDQWSFLLAAKDSDARALWFSNEAELQLAITSRTFKTKDGKIPFRFFDGASMMQYQFPSRVVETTFCRGLPCEGRHGYDPEVVNVPVSSFEVKPSIIANGGRGVFAKEFIPKGSLIGLDECVYGMFSPSNTVDLMEEAGQVFGELSEFWEVVDTAYFDGYGWSESFYGEVSAGVDPGIMTYVNHGCNGTYNVGVQLNETEMTVELGKGPEGVYDLDGNDVYNPFDERHYPMWECGKFITLRDIEAGEELFDNYLAFGGGQETEDWESNLRELKTMCSGGKGKVRMYEDIDE